MPRKIFVNLPVKNLEKSKAFFSALGFVNNPEYTDETGACMVVSDDIHVMLLTHPKFAEFTPHPIGDATKATEVLICLTCDSREEVDAIVSKAVAAGGRTFKEPVDYGFMYSQSVQDLDGHIWEWVAMLAAPAAAPA